MSHHIRPQKERQGGNSLRLIPYHSCQHHLPSEKKKSEEDRDKDKGSCGGRSDTQTVLEWHYLQCNNEIIRKAELKCVKYTKKQREWGEIERENREAVGFASGHIMAAQSVTLTGWVGGGWEAQWCPPAYTTSCLIAHWHLRTYTHTYTHVDTRSCWHTDTLTHTSGQRCEAISPAAFLMSASNWLSHHCWLYSLSFSPSLWMKTPTVSTMCHVLNPV